MAPSGERENIAATPGGRDWTVQAADTIETFVAAIRARTAIPLTTAARVLVFGLLTAVLGGTVVVLLTIALIRVVDLSVPGAVWSAYLIVGGIFTVGGGLLLRKAGRSPRGSGKRDVSH